MYSFLLVIVWIREIVFLVVAEVILAFLWLVVVTWIRFSEDGDEGEFLGLLLVLYFPEILSKMVAFVMGDFLNRAFLDTEEV